MRKSTKVGSAPRVSIDNNNCAFNWGIFFYWYLLKGRVYLPHVNDNVKNIPSYDRGLSALSQILYLKKQGITNFGLNYTHKKMQVNQHVNPMKWMILSGGIVTPRNYV